MEFDDESFGIIDFKTSSPSESSKSHYGLQLHAYAVALEKADWLHRACVPVTHLGLLCFDPGELKRLAQDGLAYSVEVTWVPIERDEAGFTTFLQGVLSILERSEAPEAGADCRWCRWDKEER